MYILIWAKWKLPAIPFGLAIGSVLKELEAGDLSQPVLPHHGNHVQIRAPLHSQQDWENRNTHLLISVPDTVYTHGLGGVLAGYEFGENMSKLHHLAFYCHAYIMQLSVGIMKLIQ